MKLAISIFLSKIFRQIHVTGNEQKMKYFEVSIISSSPEHQLQGKKQ